MLSLRTLFTAAATAMLASGEAVVPLEAMSLDDECAADATCALNALQLRAARRADPAGQEVELPEGWNSEVDFPETLDVAAILGEADLGADADAAEDDEAPAADAAETDDAPATDAAEDDGATAADDAEEESTSEASTDDDADASDSNSTTAEVTTTTTKTTTTTTQKQYFDSACKQNQHSHGCFLYRHCVKATKGSADSQYCVMSGYTIVPSFPITGTESINQGNSIHVDPIMDAAYTHCSSSKCVLMVNPKGHRTQEQLYIHYRHYNNNAGHRLKTTLESTACYQSGWHKVHGVPDLHKCKTAQVRVYAQHPTDIFSQVAEAQGKHGKHDLDGVGVTVYPKACPRGKKTMVLFTEHCTIEKSISGH